MALSGPYKAARTAMKKHATKAKRTLNRVTGLGVHAKQKKKAKSKHAPEEAAPALKPLEPLIPGRSS